MFNLLYSYYGKQETEILGITIGLAIVVLIIVLAIDIGIIVACVKIANNKGRSGGAWGFLAFLFGLVALIILACLPDISFNPYKQNVYSWVCQKCGTTNYGGGSFCYKCGLPKQKTNYVLHPVSSKEWTCPKCGQKNNLNATNCINCFAKKP